MSGNTGEACAANDDAQAMDRAAAVSSLQRLQDMESMLIDLRKLCKKMPAQEASRYDRMIDSLYLGWAQMLTSVVRAHPDLTPERHREWLVAVKEKPVPSIPWILAGSEWLRQMSEEIDRLSDGAADQAAG